jgi:hypothetical protein
MALETGLYRSQDQSEEDLANGPGWTIDQQKPTFFGNVAGAIPRGVGQGAADAIAVLAHGSGMVGQGARQAALSEAGLADDAAPSSPQEDRAAATERAAREYSKSLVADPRITGTAANLLQGFSKAATEFTAGSVAGGPLAGALLVGGSEGYGHYQDLLDQGVDDATAERSGVLTALSSGGSALLPMSMPARWVAGLSRPAAMLAQVGAGVGINTSFGAATRYASAKILDDAGYHEMAEQQRPWDATNVLTDAISGAFFGAHAGWHTLKGADEAGTRNIDPSIRDAAKVVQDRQAVFNGAPGVPVDMRSAAVHRELLETSIGDLLNDKPVDLSEIDSAGAAFAHADVDESAATKIIRDAFAKSGVLHEDDADAWMHGPDNEIEPTTPKQEPKSQSEGESQESVNTEPGGEAQGYDVGEHEEMSDELRRQFEGLRSKLPADEEPRAAGEGEPEESVPGGHAGDEAQGEPLTLHRGAQRELSPADFDDDALGHQTGRPSSGLGPFFTNDKAEAADYGNVTSHHLGMTNPLEMKAEDVPGFDSVKQAIKWREKQRAKGYDGLVIDASHMGGQTWYVPFEHSQVRDAAESRAPVKTTGSPLDDRPDLQIADERGNAVPAAEALTQATAEEQQANKEADPMHEAAVACEGRHA